MMDQQSEITKYYDDLAQRYDEDRFNNSYGRFIDSQERACLDQWLKGSFTTRGMDMACGTGRLLNYVESGCDISPEMIEVARTKHPYHVLKIGDAAALPFDDKQFEFITCFHLFMHLDRKTSEAVVEEVRRVLKPEGMFIVDVPSRPRRRWFGHKAKGWHGASSWTRRELKKLMGPEFYLEDRIGISMFPIHRLSDKWRSKLFKLDSFLCRTPLKKYASYWVLKFRKK